MIAFGSMVRAYHLILSVCGFWLPNDPRGSWSVTVRNPDLRPFGLTTKVETHRSAAHVPHDTNLRRRVVRYVEGNPARAGLRPQRWSFVRTWSD